MRLRNLVLSGLLAWLPTGASAADHPELRELAAQVQPEALRTTIQTLVGFGTRHTLSDTTSQTRGIGAARRWTQGRFEEIGRACGGCITVVTPSQTFTGERIPTPTAVVDVLGVQRGTTDPNRVIVISAHIDSRINDVLDATSDAPGANDDGSGVAAVLEAARLLSKHRFPATLVYAVLSGEEQSLYGGKALADYATAQGWQVEASLNNDIVGNTRGGSGVIDNSHVRIFSEGTKAVESETQARGRRSTGGENDSPSRNLARFMDRLAEAYLTNLDVVMIYRTDRYQRGSDQIPMLEAGFPAIRVTEAIENYDRQHQKVRVENGRRYGDVIEFVDFDYLAQVARLNILTMAALARAPAPPPTVGIAGGVSSDTRVTWTASPGAAGYRVWRRDTTAPHWQIAREAAGSARELTLAGVIVDDWNFGVSAVSADGYESPVEYPGPAGAFIHPPPAPPRPPR